MTIHFDQQTLNGVHVRAAIARMTPDRDRLHATTEAFAHAGTSRYWPLVVNTMATAINTIGLVHAAECRNLRCRTCAAISFALAANTAHQSAQEVHR
jgi:hypothetical protein